MLKLPVHLLDPLRRGKNKIFRRIRGIRPTNVGVTGIVLHCLAESKREIGSGCVFPPLVATVASLKLLINEFLENGFTFVSPQQLVSGLNPNAKYCFLSFDDGYCGVLKAVPLLETFSVPATFFVTSGAIESGNGFWWDVLYRVRAKQGTRYSDIFAEIACLANSHPDRIASYLQKHGIVDFSPKGESDRPLREDELRSLSECRHANIGNHTASHAPLVHNSPIEVREEIEECQLFIERVVGQAPVAMSFPNGSYNEGVLNIARKHGLTSLFTSDERDSPLPGNVWGRYSISEQHFTTGKIWAYM